MKKKHFTCLQKHGLSEIDFKIEYNYMKSRNTELTKRRPERQTTVADRLLHPLREGRPVMLSLNDRWTPKRSRLPHPRLFITPSGMYGLDDHLVISVEGGGTEVVPITDRIKTMPLFRAGLSMRASKALASALNDIFNKC